LVSGQNEQRPEVQPDGMGGSRRFPPVGLSLAVRLALVFGLISTMVVLIMGLGIYYLTIGYLNNQAQDDLIDLAEFYAAYTASTAPDEAQLASLAPQITGFFTPQSGYDVRLFNARNGALLSASQDLGPLPSSATLGQLDHRRPTLFVSASQDHANRLYAASGVRAAGGSPLAVIEVSRDISEMQAFTGALRLVLVAAGGLALFIALIASWLSARRMTRPLQEMESATQVIAAGDLSRRLNIGSHDEIGRLAASINGMAADLDRLENSRREFIARISHDLRTPLTAIKGLVINLQDTAPSEFQSSLATIDEQTDRLIRLVNDLLTLSRLQREALRLRLHEVDMADVARSAASLVSEKAKRMGVTLKTEFPNNLPNVLGDADRLQQVAVNLLDNALKATSAGGTVCIKASGTQREVTLTVTDNGRGLTEEENRRAFEPYFSGVGGGPGLGLAIAGEIIAAHKGRIWLKNRCQGGAEAGFALPIE